MYIQPPPRGEIPPIPSNYSGNAFRTLAEEASPDPGVPTPPPPGAPAPIPPAPPIPGVPTPPPPSTPAAPPPPPPSTPRPEASPPFAPLGGLLSRLPFFSSFFSRGKQSAAPLPDWALIALLVFLLADGDRADDVTPFLLLLLLWG